MSFVLSVASNVALVLVVLLLCVGIPLIVDLSRFRRVLSNVLTRTGIVEYSLVPEDDDEDLISFNQMSPEEAEAGRALRAELRKDREILREQQLSDHDDVSTHVNVLEL